ncbi:MAG: sigma 54-interacting transcriptional regulator [Planctomycetota bacterium]
MHRLVVVNGEDAGLTFDLAPGEHVVGRGATVEVRLADESVSRRHALLTVAEQGVTLADLDSHNGSWVNGRPVKSAPVAEGDELRFGNSRLVLESGDSPAGATVTVRIIEQDDAVRPPARRRVHLPEDSQRLRILYEVGNAINSELGQPELLERILATLFDVVPAEHGAIVLWDEQQDGWVPAAEHRRHGADGTVELSVSRAIIEEAFASGGPVFSDDARADERFGPSESIERQAIRSMICCPLAVRDERLGVLYLDTREITSAFTEDDVELVAAIANQAAIAIGNARLHDKVRRENVRLRRALGSRHSIVGESAAIREVMNVVRRVSQTDATVLVRGESGTGKEVVAQTIHALSPRCGKAFVCVNCAAMAETLLESELFGHEKGAFTGAYERRLGRFEQANGGTIFLDEIGEMPPSTQAKILRVLQEREFQRVGGTRSIRVDVRLVASTNRDLEAALASGAFRQDLYYRLKVIDIVLPPLRERRDDIVPLCQHFLSQIAREMNRQPPSIDPSALEALQTYWWPGNVRELRNVLERAMVLGVGDRLLARHLPREVRRHRLCPEELPDDLSLAASEREHIDEVLTLAGWNKSRTAALLQISRPRLDRKIKEYGLKRPDED